MEHKEFGDRLAQLRIARGGSARGMSLSLGQDGGYVNKIENGKNYPSMEMFFYICDYLGVTPEQFFQTDTPDPNGADKLFKRIKTLSTDKLSIITSLVDSWEK